jgi:hypothetical protein
MAQLGAAQELLEEKERLEREAANEIASLTQALEEEQNLRMSLEASVINLEVSNNAILSQLTKDRDNALALVGVLKKEKLSLDDDHNKLLRNWKHSPRNTNPWRVNLQFSLSKVIIPNGKLTRRKK